MTRRLRGSLLATVAAAGLAGMVVGDDLGVPDAIDVETAADLLDLAASHGMFTAAARAAREIEDAVLPSDGPLGPPAAPLPPRVRKALVRALAVPDAALQFAASRTLALAAGPPPWPGSSRVVATLARAATATGSDHVVVAHHDADVAHEIATGVSRFGYRPVVVSTGRAAVRAARDDADVVLVILGARIILPSAFETAQFIHEQPYGDIPPVLVAVDPLDDLPRGRFLTKSILKFSGLPCVALVDRMESFFQPTVDPDTGALLEPARLPAAVEEVAGVDASAAENRAARAAARLERGRQAATLLAILDRRGWDIPAVVCARLGSGSARPDPAGYNRPAFTPPPPAPADAALSEPTR